MSQEFLRPEDPQSIGPYWLASRLGAGGQGVVYEAYDGSGARCVVKVLRREGAGDDYAKDRFRKEVAASRRVDSFCTARVLAADPGAQPPYIVSEFIDGRDLQATVAAGGAFDGDALVRLATGIATALTAIHAASVVHRDLKPGNVLLGPDGPRVIDFGIARTQEMSLTETGKMMGTPGYMAPEVLRGARADGKSDVFAWGAVVLFAATGTAPFDGENLGEIVVRVTEREPDLTPVPERIRPLLAAALSKDPAGRPTSAELLFRLLTAGARDPRPPSSSDLLAKGARAAALPARASASLPEWGTVAEGVYAGLGPVERAVAEEILLRLTVPGDAPDGSQDGVRTAEYGELLHGRPAPEAAAVEQVLAAFAAERVLIRDPDGSVRPVSAALHRAWPRLAAWTAEHRATLRELRRTGDAARTWDRAGRPTDRLLHGSVLRAAADHAATAGTALRPNLVEREFLTASRAQESRRRRRRRRLRGGIAVLLATALVAGVAAWQFQRANAEQQAFATARNVAAVADGLRMSDPETAALLSAAAWQVAPAEEARAALYRSAWQRESAVFQDPTKQPAVLGNMTARRLSADGRTLVTATFGASEGKTRRFDLRTGKELASRTGGKTPSGAVSPDGRFAVQDGEVREIATGKTVGEVHGDGHSVEALASGGVRALDVDEGAASVRDTHTGDTLLRAPGSGAQLSPDARYLVSCPEDGTPLLHDIDAGASTELDGAEKQGCSDGFTASFSADSGRMVLGTTEGALAVWSTSTGEKVSEASLENWNLQAMTGENAWPLPVRMSPDGKFVAAMADSSVAVAAASDASQPLFTHPTGVANSELASDGSPLAIDSGRGELRYLEGTSVHTLSLRSLGLPRKQRDRSLARFGPDAQTLLAAENEGTRHRVRTWTLPEDGKQTPRRRTDHPVSGGTALGEYLPQGEYMAPAELSPDGGTLAYARETEKSTAVLLQDTRTGKVTRRIGLGGSPGARIAALAFGEDGRTLAVSRTTADGDDAWSVDVVDTAAGRKTRTLSRVGGYGIAVGGPAEKPLLVTTGGDRSDLSTGRTTRRALGELDLSDVAFSPDGKTLAVAEPEGVALWNGDATRRVGHLPGPEKPSDGGVTQLRFSPDGDSLVGIVGNERVHLWDIPSRQPMGGVLPGIDDYLLDVAFDDDGNLHLAGAAVDAYAMNLAPDRLTARLCAQVHRPKNLTRTEWQQNVPDAPYRKVCD
ncbi:WD40 repeat domain-containing serine/threonine-protein kinase [Streptomyces xiaopingdaonensis]|uniref:WD40 repeat domain-containing serine/threonine-protein kinase n=1 Tax=Streptomyces xiaopingdaonensis TaxID=1565415 RepID=UPI0003150C65|nr:WD40 repeat domain-containing serine/threonine-protein kinase [Streptomyces xiaopingdaonensis]